jgi:hypothetical protein
VLIINTNRKCGAALVEERVALCPNPNSSHTPFTFLLRLVVMDRGGDVDDEGGGLDSPSGNLRWPDFLVIGLYFAFVLAVGLIVRNTHSLTIIKLIIHLLPTVKITF